MVMRILSSVSLIAALLGLCSMVAAQTYPTRSVRIIVPSSPGGGSDTQARLLARRFTETMGQNFVVENRTGASGVIGAELVARAPADGYTVLFGTAQIAVSTLLLRKTPFDIVKDFAPISQISSAPQYLMVHPSVPVRSVPEFVVLAKKNPGKLNGGSGGAGTANHMAIEMLKQAASISVTHIPYRGGGPSMAALLGGEIEFNISGAVTALPHVRSGKVRALAVTSLKRTAAAPNVPTLDSFYPGYESANWYAMFAPANTAAAVINKLHAETITAIKLPDINDFMASEGADLTGSTPLELTNYLKRELARYATTIKAANIKQEN